MKVEIYGAEWCAYCKRAKKVCEANEIEHTYYDVDDVRVAADLEHRLQMPPKSIPQIWADGEYVVGGYEGLIKLV